MGNTYRRPLFLYISLSVRENDFPSSPHSAVATPSITTGLPQPGQCVDGFAHCASQRDAKSGGIPISMPDVWFKGILTKKDVARSIQNGPTWRSNPSAQEYSKACPVLSVSDLSVLCFFYREVLVQSGDLKQGTYHLDFAISSLSLIAVVPQTDSPSARRAASATPH